MKRIFAALALGWLAASSAQAEVNWTFNITNPNVVIGPTDTVSLIGEISNSASSTDVLSVPEPCPLCVIPASLTVGFSDSPVFSFDDGAIGPDPLYKTLAGIHLNPGESFSFSAYTLSPLAGAVPLGNYQFIVNDLYLAGYGISSAGTVNVAVVPEPSSSALMLGGLVFLGTCILRRNVKAQPVSREGRFAA